MSFEDAQATRLTLLVLIFHLDPRSMVQTKRALECQLPWIRAQGRDEASNRLQASPPVRTPLTLAGVVVLVVGLDIIYNIG